MNSYMLTLSLGLLVFSTFLSSETPLFLNVTLKIFYAFFVNYIIYFVQWHEV